MMIPQENTQGVAEARAALQGARASARRSDTIISGTTALLDRLREANRRPDHVADGLRAIIQGDER